MKKQLCAECLEHFFPGEFPALRRGGSVKSPVCRRCHRKVRLRKKQRELEKIQAEIRRIDAERARDRAREAAYARAWEERARAAAGDD